MKLKNIISNSFTLLLSVCAVIITFLVIRNELFMSPDNYEQRFIENWEELEFNGWQTGNKDAPIKIVEFFDYECPYCKNAQPTIHSLLENYTSDILLTYVHYPLKGHKHAFTAAIAAECARIQNRFKPYHDLLFERQEFLSDSLYSIIAQEIELSDLQVFNRCLSDQESAPVVNAGFNLAERLKINAIPAFIINGTLFTGAMPLRDFEKIINDMLADAS